MITIEINSKEVERQLLALGTATKNRAPLMRDIAGTMHKSVMENFAQGGRPKWLGIKHRSGVPLNDTGVLRKSINQHYDNDSAVVGTNLEYAAIHNFGGKAGRNRKVTIDARPFLILTDQDQGDIVDDVQNYFRKIVS